MADFIIDILKYLKCSDCHSDFETNININNITNTNKIDILKNWKLYLKEYEMYSSMILYNELLNKDISYIINKNESILLLNEDNSIYLKLEYISNNEHDNSPILVPTEDYEDLYNNIESSEKIFDNKLNAYYIGIFNLKNYKQ